MTDFNFDAKRAFVLAADQSLQNVTAIACEECHDHDGKAYIFHFARESGQSRSLSYGGGETVTTSYADISAKAVTLCDACVARYREAKRKEWTWRLIAGLPFLAAGIIAVLLTSGSTQTMVGVPTILVGIWVLVSLIMRSEFNNPEKAGRHLALSLHQDELKAQGFNAFWPDLDIDAMRREVSART